MPTGTIARLLIDKGFGFIRDEGGIEHFFHRSSVRVLFSSCFVKDSGWSSRRKNPERDLEPGKSG
jgi:hypothetical protein